jgi:hydroxyacylglutathione hydrolase
MSPTSPASPTSPLAVVAVPAFQDNYLWLVHDGTHACVVDPGDAAPVLAALDALKLSLRAILLTHHHADHVGGVPGLLARFPVPVYGPDNPTIAGISDVLGAGDRITLEAPALQAEVLAVPGHTLDHIAYYTPGLLFCGDTLFAGGCGRLFEGTPAQMAASLARLAALPPETAVYCAHEYTLANLRFALACEPGNAALAARMLAEQAARARGEPTVPTTIARELATNPFLRCREPEIVATLLASGRLEQAQAHDPVAVFAALRQWKNTF